MWQVVILIADSGEGYIYQSDCEAGAKLLKREAPNADIVVER
jgi:uncharacterized protein YegP (UPF0339 family)